jgi:hypothetical protein
LRKPEIHAIKFEFARLGVVELGPPGKKDEARFVTFWAQCDAGKDFFIWIRRNPLKSPDSAKGIQGNPSFFAWFYLVLLG